MSDYGEPVIMKYIEAQITLNADGAAALEALRRGDREPFNRYVRALVDVASRRHVERLLELYG